LGRFAAAGIVLLAVALPACGRSTGGDAPLSVWVMGREGELVRELLPEFERRHPGVRVRVQQIPWSAAHEKLLTAYVGESLPDVVQLGNTWIPELVALGALAPLDARIERAGLPRGDFFAGVMDAAVVDGATWALPWYADTRLLFYRTDLFAAAGVAAPPRTWSELRAALAQVRAHGGADRHAILLPLTEWEPLVIFALQRGATLLRDGDRYGDFASPAFRGAFDFYLSLFADGLAPARGAADLANLQQDFAAGWLASYVSGPWQLGELRRRLPASFEAQWAAAPMPGPDAEWAAAPRSAPDVDPSASPRSAPDGPGFSLAGGSSLAIVARSPRADAAWKLLEYLAEPAQQSAFYALAGDLPARRSAWSDPRLAGDAKAQVFRAQLERMRATPKVPEWERIAGRIARHAEAAVRGEETPDEALAALDREADRALEKRRWMLAKADAPERRP
jgi:multiple sugar transport system substrate-binding protein